MIAGTQSELEALCAKSAFINRDASSNVISTQARTIERQLKKQRHERTTRFHAVLRDIASNKSINRASRSIAREAFSGERFGWREIAFEGAIDRQCMQFKFDKTVRSFKVRPTARHKLPAAATRRALFNAHAFRHEVKSRGTLSERELRRPRQSLFAEPRATRFIRSGNAVGKRDAYTEVFFSIGFRSDESCHFDGATETKRAHELTRRRKRCAWPTHRCFASIMWNCSEK